MPYSCCVPLLAEEQYSRRYGDRLYFDAIPNTVSALVWDLNYFFKSYHHFFKSAVLWVCDITIFSNEYHDYCKSSYHFLSRR